MAKTATKAATRMTPSKNATPFAGVTLAQPQIDKIDRGIRDLATNYGLKNKLRWTMGNENSSWTFELYNVDETAPLATMTNRSIGGLNRFLTTCGAVVARKYGQTEAKARKTA